MNPSPAPSLPVPCAAWVDRLAALHPADLAPDERTALQDHLASCPACAAVYMAYQHMDARILSLPVVQLSAQQLARVEAVIADQTAHERETAVAGMVQEHRMPPVREQTRLVRVGRRVNSVAAILVVTALVASVFALFSLRRAPFPTSPTWQSTPAELSSAGTVYTVSSDGTVYAINPESGNIKWSMPLQMTPDEQFLVSHGTIYLASSCIQSTCDLYALRASDGHVLWQRSYHDLLGYSGATSLTRYLAGDGTALYIGSATGIYAWRASDGRQLWQHAPPTGCACQVDLETTGNGLVYVYFDGLYALNATDGATRWSNLQAPDMLYATTPLVVTHNHVYVPMYRGSVTVHVLDADTGTLLDTPGLPQVTAAAILTDDSAVYISTAPATGSGTDIYGVRSDDNRLLWHQHDAQVIVPETVSAGGLYYNYTAASTSLPAQNVSITPTLVASSTPSPAMSTATTRICARRTADGSLQGCQSFPDGYLASAAASQGIAYGPGDGLVAIRLSDGKVLWHILAHIQLDDADTVLV